MTFSYIKQHMRRAIESAQTGIRRGEGGPFGACLVKGREVIATAHNTVLKKQDATCHAEINAIRVASKYLGSFDLSGTVLYSTTEPCPMCFSAIHWARVDTVAFGTRIQDVASRGFHELRISNREMKRLSGSRLRVRSGFLRAECLQLLKEWDAGQGRQVY